MFVRSLMAVLAVSTSFASIAAAQDQQVLREKAPEWVVERDVNRPTEETGAAADLFLMDSQARVDAEKASIYLKMVMRPNNRAGLQQVGTVYFPWVSDRGPAYLHELTIHRDGTVVDRLSDADIRVIDQNQQLEQSMLNGIKTVMVPVPGLQVGDEVHVAYGFDMRKDLFGLPPEQLYVKANLGDNTAFYQRMVADEKDGIRVKYTPHYGKVSAQDTKFGKAYDVRVDRLALDGSLKPPIVPVKADDEEDETLAIPEHAPADKVIGFFQAAPYATWNDAAAAMRPFYADVTDIDPDGELAQVADRIMADHDTPRARMLEALRVVQEDVRYIAILLGQGAFTPVDPEQAFRDRAADCKASTAILMALLSRMGIANDALLVRSEQGGIISGSLPALMLFDHVIARAHIDGQTYYLDGTGFGDLRADDLKGNDFEYGLPLVANADLVAIPRAMGTVPDMQYVIEWDGSNGLAGEVPFTATIRMAGSHAAETRASLSQAPSRDVHDTMMKSMLPGIPNDDIDTAELVDRDDDGTLLIRYSGLTRPEWEESTSFEGLPEDAEKGDRYRLNAALDATDWPVDFDREEGPYRDWDVNMGSPYWETTRETFLLPAADADLYATEVEGFTEKLAGADVTRTITREGRRVEITTEYRGRTDRITAAEARAAQERIDEITDADIYLYSPVGFKPEEGPDAEADEDFVPPPIVRVEPTNG